MLNRLNKDRLTLLGTVGLGAGLGAGLMYLLDPTGGRQRRALAKDKCLSAARAGGTAVGKASRDLGNRTKGLLTGASSRLRGGVAQSSELASHGDSLHHSDLLAHPHAGSSALQGEPFQPVHS